MTISFAIIAIIVIASGVAAMTMRNLVHCALSLIVTLGGLAGIYLQLGAQFVGFAQILVYVGAVAILIVFAILLTRGSDAPQQAIVSPGWIVGAAVAVVVFGLLAWMIAGSGMFQKQAPEAPAISVSQIGQELMTGYVLPLEVVGLLLTAALIGAVIIAMQERDHALRGSSAQNTPGPLAVSAGEGHP